jgi:hypothetical protein
MTFDPNSSMPGRIGLKRGYRFSEKIMLQQKAKAG